MGLIKKYYKLVSVLSVAVCIMAACTVSYKFNGASINYDKVKTISFENFPNRSAAFVWGPMESMFNTALQDIYMQNSLEQVRQGEIWNCQVRLQTTMLIIRCGSDGYSTMAELRMTVNVRFVNNTNHAEDFEQQFSASREYNASQQLSSVQEDLVNQMIDEIVEQIFNATVANW